MRADSERVVLLDEIQRLRGALAAAQEAADDAVGMLHGACDKMGCPVPGVHPSSTPVDLLSKVVLTLAGLWMKEGDTIQGLRADLDAQNARADAKAKELIALQRKVHELVGWRAACWVLTGRRRTRRCGRRTQWHSLRRGSAS